MAEGWPGSVQATGQEQAYNPQFRILPAAGAKKNFRENQEFSKTVIGPAPIAPCFEKPEN